MNCIEAEKYFDDLLDDNLQNPHLKETGNHLENCLSCKQKFAALQMISGNLKEVLPVTAPTLLDVQVISAFRNFQKERAEIKPQKKRGFWFGIPRFAYAPAAVLLLLTALTAFQIGKSSAVSNAGISQPIKENPVITLKEKNNASENPTLVKTIEVPVVKEKLVYVPVIKEKIITKKIFVKEKTSSNNNLNDLQKSKTPSSTEAIEANRFFTAIDLSDFKPIADIKPQIIKNTLEK